MEAVISNYIENLPLDADLKRRIAIGLSCDDCQSIPKIAQAGETFSSENERYQLMHNGIKVVEDGYCGRWMTELIRLLHGHHEPQEEKVFHEVLSHIPDNSSMIELGSYWAYYSLWFNQQVRNAKIYLIEPDPNNLNIGKHNFALNDAEGEFHQYSIGRVSTDPKPFTCESDGQTRLIPEISVDDFISANKISFVEMLFADIQGAELNMLEGAANSISQGKIRFLFVSTHHHSISGDALTHQKCLEFLNKQNAHIIAAHNVTESYSGDGLIVASFQENDRSIAPVQISKNHPTNSVLRELEYDLDEAHREIKTLRSQLQEAQSLKTQLHPARLIRRLKNRLRVSKN